VPAGFESCWRSNPTGRRVRKALREGVGCSNGHKDGEISEEKEDKKAVGTGDVLLESAGQLQDI
jgi:hypothetical protein